MTEELPPTQLESLLSKRLKTLEHILEKKKKLLDPMISQTICVSNHGRTPQFYTSMSTQNKVHSDSQASPHETASDSSPHGHHGTYISKKELPYIKKILQSEYDFKVVKALEWEIHQLSRYLKKVPEHGISNINSRISSSKLPLITPLTYPDEAFVNTWINKPYKKKPFSADEPTFDVTPDLKVRSKSEVLIAQTLIKEAIPFRYEFPITLGGVTIHPDFFCLNRRTHECVIWEHFGMMDNESYATKAAEKLIRYADYGYFPGQELICTFETKRMPLNLSQINQMIHNFLK